MCGVNERHRRREKRRKAKPPGRDDDEEKIEEKPKPMEQHWRRMRREYSSESERKERVGGPKPEDKVVGDGRGTNRGDRRSQETRRPHEQNDKYREGAGESSKAGMTTRTAKKPGIPSPRHRARRPKVRGVAENIHCAPGEGRGTKRGQKKKS